MRKLFLCFRAGLAAAAIAGGCVALAPAAAQSQSAGPTAVVGERNVYAGGGQVRPAAPVPGDFSAAGGKVILDQPVGADASLAGGSVEVRAPVGDDLRVVGGDVTVGSTVGGELFASGGNISVTPAAAVSRGASLYGGSIAIDGRIDGMLRATARRITVDGDVRGDARLVAEEIELGPKARIGGSLTYVSRAELKKADGATIVGPVAREVEPGMDNARGRGWQWQRTVPAPSWGGGLMSFLALLAVAAMFLLLVPRFGASAAQRIQASPLRALAAGLATFIALPLIALLLFITLLGIPLGIALLALGPALMLAGFVIGVLFVARLLAAARRKDWPATFGGSMAYVALALLLILLAYGVPFVGGVAGALLTLAGVGAFVLEVHGRRKGPGEGARATPPVLPTAAQAHGS